MAHAWLRSELEIPRALAIWVERFLSSVSAEVHRNQTSVGGIHPQMGLLQGDGAQQACFALIGEYYRRVDISAFEPDPGPAGVGRHLAAVGRLRYSFQKISKLSPPSVLTPTRLAFIGRFWQVVRLVAQWVPFPGCVSRWPLCVKGSCRGSLIRWLHRFSSASTR